MNLVFLALLDNFVSFFRDEVFSNVDTSELAGRNVRDVLKSYFEVNPIPEPDPGWSGYNFLPEGIANLQKCTGLNVKKLDTKHNALGNLICVNDKGGIISPIVEKEFIKEIADVLDIEVIQKKVAGFHQGGAVMEANNLGGVIHPEADEEDIKNFSNILGVNIEPATINGGIPFVSSGMLANNHAVVVGNLTNGPEIMMLTRAFTN